MKVLVSGGGTGGHIAPAIAVIEALKKQSEDAKFIFVGTKGSLEEKIVPQVGIKFYSIFSGKFRRYHHNLFLNIFDPKTIFKNIVDIKNVTKGFFEALKILKDFNPDVVFLKGGYGSLPIGLACILKGYPFVIHESDTSMGLSNKILSKKAINVFVSFPKNNFDHANKNKIIFSGNPIRKDVLEGNIDRGYEVFKLSKNLPTVLVIGGSQGAHVINEILYESLEKILIGAQVIHISGDQDYDWLNHKCKNLAEDLRSRYRLYNFLSTDLKDAYAVSDLVVTRAGNNVLTEIAALSKPSIVIPLESSANDHQNQNATAFSREGAICSMAESKITTASFLKQVNFLLDDEEERSYMSEKIHKFYKPEAADIIAENIIKIYENRLTGKSKDAKREKKATKNNKKP